MLSNKTTSKKAVIIDQALNAVTFLFMLWPFVLGLVIIGILIGSFGAETNRIIDIMFVGTLITFFIQLEWFLWIEKWLFKREKMQINNNDKLNKEVSK